MIEIDNCLSNLKTLYVNSNDNEQDNIVKILQKLSESSDVNNIYDIALSVVGINKITDLPSRETLLCDIISIENSKEENKEGMLIFLHINQIAALKELYGLDVAKKVVLDKAQKLKDVLSLDEVSLYNIDLQRFAILVKDKNLFEKYFSIVKYSILNNMDNEMFESECGISIISDFTIGICEGEHLYHRANVALQEAIIEKKQYKIYESCVNSQELQRTSLDRLNIYKSALHDGNITPYFQPIVDVKDESVMKYEALARIITKDGTVISPYEFLNAAIEDKTFEFFTRQMTQKVFNIYDKTYSNISMNLTYDNINSPSMVSYLKNRLDKYGGDRMTFEIVETEEIKDYEVVENFILMVKEYGAKVSIDDFGSGYSNFTNIIKLNIDYIKIDGTLITKLLEDQKVRNMVGGLIQFAKSIDVQTIAEFVSSKEIYDEVKGLGVDYIQGYYFGEPKPAKEYGLV